MPPAASPPFFPAAPQAPEDPSPGDGFQDRLLWLIAALSLTGDMLTHAGYQAAQRALETVFGERALDAAIQAKLLHALLHPHPDPLDLARTMALQARQQMVSAMLIETMLAALAGIRAEREHDPVAGALYQEIEWAFRKANLERASDQDAGWVERLGLDVTDSLAGLYRLSKRLVAPMSAPERRTPGLLAAEAAQFTLRAQGWVDALERLARTVEDRELLADVLAFRRFMDEQPYRIVVAGERKRGKSSLVNALVGRALSPTRETSPETATIVEFRHADAPDYSVRFLDEAQFAHLERYLEGEERNTLLTAKIRAIRQGVEAGTFVPGKLLAGITSWDDLPDYIGAGGRYAGFVARVCVSLPLSSLRDGVVVVDTPGLNDTDAFHDYLAYEESLGADGILFVMDARNPGAGTELSLLRRLARAGRTVGVIGVLTHIDKLDEGDSLNQAVEQAAAVLREACREAPEVRVYGVAPLNAREAMRERCADKPAAPDSRFACLLRLVQDMMSHDAARSDYRAKRSAAFARLVDQGRASLSRYREQARRALPDRHVLAMLSSHADQLLAANEQSLEQARRIVSLAGRELDGWERETERNLEAFRDNLVLRLTEAVRQEMDAAASGFARPAVWKRFAGGAARQIARDSVEAFLDHERAALIEWENKLRHFSAELNVLAAQCLERAARAVADLDGSDREGGVGMEGSAATHLLVRTHQHMRTLALFSTGVAAGTAAGAAVGMTPLLFLLTAGNVLSLSAGSPAVLAAVAMAAGAVGLVRRFGNPEKRKAEFLRRKKEEAEVYADRIRAVLRDELAAMRDDVGRAYDLEVRRGFMPVLESLACQAAHMRNFLDVMARIETDAERYESLMQDQLFRAVAALGTAGG